MKLKYEPALDGVRALAALAVLLHHSGVPGFAGGGRGVDLFFVMSGYLITSLLLAGPMTPAEFMRRRAVRLMPAMLTMLAVSVACDPALWRDALLSAAYLFDFEMAFRNHPSALNHMWSLAVEAQFYVAWPFALPWIARSNPRRRLLLLWALMTGVRTLLAIASPEPHLAYNLPVAHASGLVLGAAIAFTPPRSFGLWPLVGLATLVALPNGSALQMSAEITVAEVFSAALLLSLNAGGRSAELLTWEPLRLGGLLSYGVYLWHYPILHAMPAEWGWTLRAPVAAVGATVLSAASFLTVERWAKASWNGRAPTPVTTR